MNRIQTFDGPSYRAGSSSALDWRIDNDINIYVKDGFAELPVGSTVYHGSDKTQPSSRSFEELSINTTEQISQGKRISPINKSLFVGSHDVVQRFYGNAEPVSILINDRVLLDYSSKTVFALKTNKTLRLMDMSSPDVIDKLVIDFPTEKQLIERLFPIRKYEGKRYVFRYSVTKDDYNLLTQVCDITKTDGFLYRGVSSIVGDGNIIANKLGFPGGHHNEIMVCDMACFDHAYDGKTQVEEALEKFATVKQDTTSVYKQFPFDEKFTISKGSVFFKAFSLGPANMYYPQLLMPMDYAMVTKVQTAVKYKDNLLYKMVNFPYIRVTQDLRIKRLHHNLLPNPDGVETDDEEAGIAKFSISEDELKKLKENYDGVVGESLAVDTWMDLLYVFEETHLEEISGNHETLLTLDGLSQKMEPYVADRHYNTLIEGKYIPRSFAPLKAVEDARIHVKYFPYEQSGLGSKSDQITMDGSFKNIEGYPHLRKRLT